MSDESPMAIVDSAAAIVAAFLGTYMLVGLVLSYDKVRWKLTSVYRGFLEGIRPALLERRGQEPALLQPRELSGLDVVDMGPVDEQCGAEQP